MHDVKYPFKDPLVKNTYLAKNMPRHCCNTKVLFFYLISISNRVTNSQLQLDVGLFQLVSVSLEPDRRLLVVAGVALEVGVKERVHQGRFSETGLADAHDVECEPALNRLVDQLKRNKISTLIIAILKCCLIFIIIGSMVKSK